jgi:hypothetical protein
MSKLTGGVFQSLDKVMQSPSTPLRQVDARVYQAGPERQTGRDRNRKDLLIAKA